jgi:hypothetical protein
VVGGGLGDKLNEVIEVIEVICPEVTITKDTKVIMLDNPLTGKISTSEARKHLQK